MKKSITCLVIAMLLMILAGCQEATAPTAPLPAAAEADKCRDSVPVLPPWSEVHGLTYAEWSQAWWQWLISIPIDQNPGLDPDGSFVALNQSGPVWFLAPNYGQGQVDVRYATIPQGRMLFIDLAAFVGCPAIGDPSDPAELYAVLAASVDAIEELVFEVDGRPLRNLADYRVQSPLFELTFPENNVFGVEPGAYYPAAADGYYAMLAPLSVGRHTIHIFTDFGEIFGTSEVTFHLTVAPNCRPRQHHGH